MGDSEILEIRCGDGYTRHFLIQKGLRIIGIDSSPTAVEYARKNTSGMKPGAQVEVADITTESCLNDRQFPSVLDSHCLHCICDSDDRMQFLKNCRRLIGDNGKLFLLSMADQPLDWLEEGGIKKYKVTTANNGCQALSMIYPGTSQRMNVRIYIKEDVLRDEITNSAMNISKFEDYIPADGGPGKSFLLEVVSS